jgi:hypothetical protein
MGIYVAEEAMDISATSVPTTPTAITIEAEIVPTNKGEATKTQTPAKPANNLPSAPAVVVSSDSKETIGEALRQLGLEPEFKGDFVAARGKTYGKSEMLKSLGFAYKVNTKVWYRKVA